MADTEKATCQCPFCETPAHTVEDLSDEVTNNVMATHRCGTAIHRKHGIRAPIAEAVDSSDLCIARQRLFDDVLARICSSFDRVATGAVPNNAAHAPTHREVWDFHPKYEALDRARAVVAARYPLPAKGDADARD